MDSPPPSPQAAKPDGAEYGCSPRIAWADPAAPGWVPVTVELEENVLPRGQVEVTGPATGYPLVLEDGGHKDGPEGPLRVAPLQGWRFWVLPCEDLRESPDVALVLDDGRRAFAALGGISPVRLEPRAPLEKTAVSGRLVRRGAPVAGVRVDGLLSDGAVTDDDGRFALSCVVVPGTEVLRVQGPWFFQATQSEKWLAFDGGALGDLEVRQRAPVEPGLLGLYLETADAGGVVVTSRVRLGPAWSAGLEVGDVVLEVDGVGVATFEEARPRIVGQPGTPVRLKVRRGGDVFFFDVERQRPVD